MSRIKHPPQVTGKPQFTPWASNLILAFYGAVTLALSYKFLFQRGHESAFILALIVVGAFTIYQWKQFVRRSYGKRVEQRAINELAKVVKKKDGASLRTGVMVASGGDADALLVINGVRFNVEIKSIESPSKVSAAHALQAEKAGNSLFSVPVIWLPRASSREAREKNGVQIFAGEAKYLVEFLERLQ